jgi:hypothetical protein
MRKALLVFPPLLMAEGSHFWFVGVVVVDGRLDLLAAELGEILPHLLEVAVRELDIRHQVMYRNAGAGNHSITATDRRVAGNGTRRLP